MRALTPLLPWLMLLLSSCSSPPKPPSVDESNRRPANSAHAVELQSCRSELQNTRILAVEASRLAESATMTAARWQERQQAILSVVSDASSAPANVLFAVHFDFGSTKAVMPAALSAALLPAARSAPLLVLRGRTDGNSDAPAESRIARERSTAVRDALIAAGVDPARIRSTFQPSGDHAADNSTVAGRRLNRRVEIEVYRALPVAADGAEVATQ